MADPTTTYRGFAVPTRGSDSGTWDTPVNGNFNTLDSILSAVTTVSVSSSNVILSLTQANSAVLRFTGTLTTSISIILPQSMAGWWWIDNLATPTSNYISFCNNNGSGGAAGQLVAVPSGTRMAIFSDGTNMKFGNDGGNFPGSYKLYSGTALPAWVTACTVLPWLICDGATYNVSTFPTLGAVLGGTYGGNGVTTFAVPDLRGRSPLPLDPTLSRITAAGCGINGNALGSSGGEQVHQLTNGELPALNPALAGQNSYNPGTLTITSTSGQPLGTNNTGSSASGYLASSGTTLTYQGTATVAVPGYTPTGNVSFGSGLSHQNVQPSLVSGIMLIKT